MRSKVVIILGLFVLFALTGCSNNTQTLSCTANENGNGLETTSKLDVSFKENVVKDMKLTMNVTFPEEMLQYKQAMIQQLQQKTNQVYSTKDGIRAIFGMGSSYFKELGLSSDVSFGELKQVLVLQGYNCEE